MGKAFEIEVEVPQGLKAGDRFSISIEAPHAPRVRKRKIIDTPLDQMTMAQLKQERINARSVLYKAVKRDDTRGVINATKRVNAVAKEIAKRNGTTVYEEVNAPLGLFVE